LKRGEVRAGRNEGGGVDKATINVKRCWLFALFFRILLLPLFEVEGRERKVSKKMRMREKSVAP